MLYGNQVFMIFPAIILAVWLNTYNSAISTLLCLILDSVAQDLLSIGSTACEISSYRHQLDPIML